MMKMYEKLCELKGCDTLTGRVIEQRIRCTATRYPEINKKVSGSVGVSVVVQVAAASRQCETRSHTRTSTKSVFFFQSQLYLF